MREYDYMVSVFMLTYQHANYIRQALDSVLMQKVNFRYEIVIGDDCSSDGTQEILLEYKERYPDKIHLMLNKRNIGATGNSIRVLKHCRGKYIAILEGDDFWTDDRKLQIQVDFLEQNPEYSACYHHTDVIGNDKKRCRTYKMARYDIDGYDRYFANIPSLPAPSFMMRNIYLENDYYRYYRTRFVGDRITQALLLKHGKIKYIDKKMCTYRFITNGSSSYSSQSNVIRQRDYIQALKIQREIVPEKYYDTISEIILQRYKDVMQSLLGDRKYKEVLVYWWSDLTGKEKIKFIRRIIGRSI